MNKLDIINICLCIINIYFVRILAYYYTLKKDNILIQSFSIGYGKKVFNFHLFNKKIEIKNFPVFSSIDLLHYTECKLFKLDYNNFIYINTIGTASNFLFASYLYLFSTFIYSSSLIPFFVLFFISIFHRYLYPLYYSFGVIIFIWIFFYFDFNFNFNLINFTSLYNILIFNSLLAVLIGLIHMMPIYPFRGYYLMCYLLKNKFKNKFKFINLTYIICSIILITYLIIQFYISLI